jgi:hypothetical protein
MNQFALLYFAFLIMLNGCSHNNPIANVIGLSASSQKTQDEIIKTFNTLSTSKANEIAQTKIVALKSSDTDASVQWLEEYCDFNLFKSGDTNVAKTFLSSVAQDESLNEAQDDAIQECLAAIDLWTQQKGKSEKVNADLSVAKSDMVLLREKFAHNKAAAKKDPKLKNVLKNSSAYIRLNLNKKGPELAEALLLLAEVAENLDDPKLSPAETMLLKKVIRDFHHSEFAESAYDQLFERVHFGYTGSSGDKTPMPIQEMLGRHRQLILKKQ